MPVNTAYCKNILFDLGGVLINIDYDLLVSSFSKIGLEDFKACYSKAKQTDLFDRFEKGEIGPAVFRKKLLEYCKPGTREEDIDKAWNAMLLDFPRERLELLLKLKKTHRTFLLSNTNHIHMQFIHHYLKDEYGVRLDDHFEKVYLSYEIGMRKPDAEIFRKVLDDNGLKAEETLFIEDSPQHVESASKLGIRTYLLDVKKEDVITVLGLR